MIFETLVLGPLQNNIYLLADEKSKEGVIIDATWYPEQVAQLARGYRIKSIVITHGHVDHCCGAGRLKELVGGEIAIHNDDLFLYERTPEQAAMFGLSAPRLPPPDRVLADGDRITFGPYALEVMHTPGHSPGAVCLKLERQVFSGDTLFALSVGRTDLWGGSMEALLRSIRTKLLTLSDETRVYPGHGPSTTIGEERRHNPFLT